MCCLCVYCVCVLLVMFMCCFFFFFFFKQKTAYEMRISDWSSDVCSSDLDRAGAPDARLVESELIAVDRGLKPLEPLVHDLGCDLIGHLRGGRARPGRIFEAERLRVAHLVDEAQRLLEIGIGTAGEADDEIARQRDIRPHGAPLEPQNTRGRG